jgi:hypothetical protein
LIVFSAENQAASVAFITDETGTSEPSHRRSAIDAYARPAPAAFLANG